MKESWVVYQYFQLEKQAKELGLEVNANGNSFSITNSNKKIDSYCKNWVFFTSETVDGLVAYVNGIETAVSNGAKLDFKTPILKDFHKK